MKNSSMDMGYQRENLTWPQDPLVLWMRWTLMIWKDKMNSQQRELKSITWTNKEVFDKHGKPWILQTRL